MSLLPLLVLTPKKAFRGGAARFLFVCSYTHCWREMERHWVSAISHPVWLSYKQHSMERCFCSFSPGESCPANNSIMHNAKAQLLTAPRSWMLRVQALASGTNSGLTVHWVLPFEKWLGLSHMHPHTVLPKVWETSQHLWKGVRGPGQVFPRRD